MRKWMLGLSMLLAVFVASPAFAVIGTADSVPAATLLLPYFEVNYQNPSGITTLFSINNASASAGVAHVTLWTDQGIPTLNFDVYLTGYDVQTINLRDVFNGILPLTADSGSDPKDTISHKGPLSQDINFPPSVPPGPAIGPCGDASSLYTSPLTAAQIDALRNAHTGQAVTPGQCAGANFGDGVARGYITVDSVSQCTTLFPSSATYFNGGIADSRNILWGDYFYVNPGENFAQGDTLVHIESCPNPAVGSGTGKCPFLPGQYTFYGRYAAVAGQDQREPLATTFATRYINGGLFNGGTTLQVWRDTKSADVSTYACAQPGPATWYPLSHTDVVGFDEQENPTDLCALPNNTSPVVGGSPGCFPHATQRVDTLHLSVTAPFGWLYLNLNFALATADPFPGRAQAWVGTVMEADGRFSVGFQAIQLDNAATIAGSPSGVILKP